MRAAPALLAAAAACAGPIEGSWSGTCSLLDGDRERELEVDLYLRERAGGAIEGAAEVEDQDYDYSVTGARAGDRVDLEMDGTTDEGRAHATIKFSGTLDAEAGRMEGDAAYWVELRDEDGNVEGTSDPWEGSCVLERAGS